MALTKLFPSEPSFNEDNDQELLQPSVDNLPRNYTFKKGLRVVIRNATRGDIPRLYALMSETSSKSRGFSPSEFLTVNVFELISLNGNYCLLVEELGSGKLVGYTAFGDHCWFMRTRIAKIGESAIVISEEFQGSDISQELLPLLACLQRELGCEGILNDTLLSNYRRFRTSFTNDAGGMFLGMIPREGYRDGSGWEDGLLMYVSLERYAGKTFSAILDENEAKFSHNSSKL